VHSAVVSFNIEDLEVLVKKQYDAVYELEKAIACKIVTGKEPMMWLARDKGWSSWFSYLLCR